MEQDTNQPYEDNQETFVNPEDVKPFPTASRWGLYGGLASIALGLIFYLTGISNFEKRGGGVLPQIMSYVVWIGTIVMAIRAHKTEDLGGYITFKRAFGTGALAGLIFAIITGIWTYLFFAMIAPDALDMIREMSYNTMAERGMSEEEIEQASGLMSSFTSPAFISLSAFFSSAVISLIISLIAGAIMKQDRPFA